MSEARVAAASAGSQPKPLHPNAIRAMSENGIDISRRRPKHFSVFTDQRFDHVISLCDRVREVCPQFPGPAAVAHWSLPDPAAEAESGDPDHPSFVRTADELKTRIDFLLHTINGAETESERI
jgi:ArsR family transcriptional regulator, arsenate/arsenite/antimonite-responsive transcriptional repressor / arsenate reductase (thioredoxin)